MIAGKFTPGPWVAEFSGEPEFENLKIRGKGNDCVVNGCGCCGSPFGDNAADIDLIIAAPDLYAALAEITACYEAQPKSERDHELGARKTMAWLEASRVLRKARGEQK